MTRKSRPLLWPMPILGLLVVCQIFSFFSSELVLVGLFGALLGTVLALVWWLFFSRRPWRERLGAILLVAVAAVSIGGMSLRQRQQSHR